MTDKHSRTMWLIHNTNQNGHQTGKMKPKWLPHMAEGWTGMKWLLRSTSLRIPRDKRIFRRKVYRWDIKHKYAPKRVQKMNKVPSQTKTWGQYVWPNSRSYIWSQNNQFIDWGNNSYSGSYLVTPAQNAWLKMGKRRNKRRGKLEANVGLFH